MEKQLYTQLKEIYPNSSHINIDDKKFINFINDIQKKQNLLENVSNSITDAIFYKDLDQTYLGCNKHYADFLGITPKEIIGKKDSDFFDAKTVQTFHVTKQLLLEEGKKIEYKHWIKYKNKKVYVMTSKSPLFDTKGSIIGIVGISRDITKEFKLQKEIDEKNLMLIQQNKFVSMGEMIADIAHQWRQPLNLMGLILQKMDIYSTKEILEKKTLKKMTKEAMFLLNEMSQTIDDFRNFFSPNKRKEDFNIKEAIDKSSYILKSQLERNNISFNYDSKKDYYIYGHKNEFFQVIMNLVHNAIDTLIIDKIASPSIKVKVKDFDNTICIDITDNANGIKKSNIDRVFEPYFTTKEHGTGLGLYMSKIIIEKHMGGKLSVKSDIYGTTLTIKIAKGKPTII